MNATKALCLLFSAANLSLLNGCASIVYKDAATQYVTASKSLVQAISDNESAFRTADNRNKALIIAKDPSCPIAQDRLFVREANAPKFSQYIDNQLFVTHMHEVDIKENIFKQCEKLKSDEAHSANTGCYTVDEGDCLRAMDKYYTNNKNADKNADNFSDDLKRIEYDKAVPNNKLIAQTITILTTYMDLLGKVADNQTEDLQSDADNLTKRITTLEGEYTKYTGKSLTLASQTKKKISALGSLFSDVEKIKKGAKQADVIKTIVTTNESNVASAIADLSPAIDAEVWMNSQQIDMAVMDSRNLIESVFHDERNEYKRLNLFNEMRKNEKYTSANDLIKKVDGVFVQLKKSYTALVSLIESPTDDQLKAIRNEEFQNFKNVIGDAASVVALFK